MTRQQPILKNGDDFYITENFFREMCGMSAHLKQILQAAAIDRVLKIVWNEPRATKQDNGIPCEWNGCPQLARGKNKFCEHHAVQVRARLAEMPNESRASIRETLFWGE